LFVDDADTSFMQSQTHLGNDRPRVAHPGSKRGTPYSPSWDVHAAIDMACTDCHATEGHRIAKGTHTTTMMANDLPNIEVACENCHGAAPHESSGENSVYLNAHIAKVACQTCHIPSLHPDNATWRDFGKSTYEEEAGIYVYTDTLKETAPNKGIAYVWWNGDATFLGNPIGDNPNGKNLYRFYTGNMAWPEFKDFNYTAWYDSIMRPIAQHGRPSKLYAMKIFNGRQHIDLQNIGPFGGMYVPYSLPTYYRTGDADLAARTEMDKSMMREMYGPMFTYYLMNRFMSYMAIDGWNGSAYDDVRAGRKVEPRWLPNNASLEISHAIRRDGALTCANCHGSEGILDWQALGYTPEEATRLSAPH
jgi:hypothetical protein